MSVFIAEITFNHHPRGAVNRLKKIAHFLLSYRFLLRAATLIISLLGISKLVSGKLAKIDFWDNGDTPGQELPRNYVASDERLERVLEWLKS